MFVRVYPLLRLPRKFGVFDYALPPDMTVAVGDIVRAPFHNRTILAIVAECSETTEVRGKIATILDLAFPAALHADDITRIAALADGICQSPCTIFFAIFGSLKGDTQTPRMLTIPRPTLSLSKDTAELVQQYAAQITQQTTTVCQLSPEGSYALTQLLCTRRDGQMLIVVPRERDARLIGELLNLGPTAATLHGHTPLKERERLIHAWRRGTLTTLVGTLTATLLPAAALRTVVVLSTGTDDHFSDRRNPRLDNRVAAGLQAAQHKATLVLCDVLPRCEEVASFPDNLTLAERSHVQVIDLKKPEEATDMALLSETLLAETKNALQNDKKVLLFYNRKGVAKRVQCANCQQVLVCPDCGSLPAVRPPSCQCVRCGHTFTIPEACPGCTVGKLRLRGVGNVHLEKHLTALFPDIIITRVEKGHPIADQARILLVTEYYFTSVLRPFARKEFGVVADLAIDLSLNPEDFRAAETTARKLHRLAALGKQQGAVTLAQSWLPEAIDVMHDAQQFLTDECVMRQQYGLPPYTANLTARHVDPAAMTALLGYPFIDVEALRGCQGRIPYDALPHVRAQLQTLPDTAVLSFDQTYVMPHRPPQS